MGRVKAVDDILLEQLITTYVYSIKLSQKEEQISSRKFSTRLGTREEKIESSQCQRWLVYYHLLLIYKTWQIIKPVKQQSGKYHRAGPGLFSYADTWQTANCSTYEIVRSIAWFNKALPSTKQSIESSPEFSWAPLLFNIKLRWFV